MVVEPPAKRQRLTSAPVTSKPRACKKLLFAKELGSATTDPPGPSSSPDQVSAVLESLAESLEKAVALQPEQHSLEGPQSGVSTAQKRRVDEQEMVVEPPAKMQRLTSAPVAAKPRAHKKLLFAKVLGSATTGQKKAAPVVSQFTY